MRRLSLVPWRMRRTSDTASREQVAGVLPAGLADAGRLEFRTFVVSLVLTTAPSSPGATEITVGTTRGSEARAACPRAPRAERVCDRLLVAA